MKIVAVLLLGLSLISCRYYATKKYHLNNSFDFKTKSEYLNAFNKKKIGEPFDLLYIDSADYLNFYINKMSNDSAVVYLGCFLNDSTSIKKSESLLDNTSCSGRIQQEVKSNLKMNQDSMKLNCKREMIRDFKFREVATGRLVNFNNEDEMKFMFIYATGFGSYYDELYQWIIKSKSESKSKSIIYFISIDPVYQLK